MNQQKKWFWGLLIGIGIAVLLDLLLSLFLTTRTFCVESLSCTDKLNSFLLGLRFFIPAGATLGLFFGLLFDRKVYSALVVLVIGGISLYLIFMRPPTVLEISQQVQHSTSGTKDDTSDWKTYSSAQYGFEFKYPSDYLTRTENSNIFVEKQNGGLYAMVIIDNPSKLSASEYFEKFKNDNKRQCEIGPCASILSSKVIQINNLQAVEAELAGEGSRDVRSIYFSVGNKIINYQYGRDNLNTEFGGNHTLYNAYISNGDKILSTFKLR